MDRVKEVSHTPDIKFGHDHGIYRVIMQTKDGHTYPTDMNEEDYRVLMMKQKMYFEMLHIPEDVINEFESLVRDVINRNRDEDNME